MNYGKLWQARKVILEHLRLHVNENALIFIVLWTTYVASF